MATGTVVSGHPDTIVQRNGLFHDPLIRGVGLLGLGGTVLVVAASPLLASFLDAGVLDVVAFGSRTPRECFG